MWIARPIKLSNCSNRRQFISRILAQQFAVKIVVAVFVASLFPDAGLADHGPVFQEPLLAAVLLIILAPWVETLMFQTSMIEICRAWHRSRRTQLVAGSGPFAALHFLGGAASGIAAGIVGGLYFTHTYLECREQSWWTATWITAVTHSLHNLIVFPVLFASSA